MSDEEEEEGRGEGGFNSVPTARRRPLSLSHGAGAGGGRRGAPHGAENPLNLGDGGGFRLKSGRELVRALLVLRLCAFPRLVRHAGTFVGGETPPGVGGGGERLRAVGLRPMLAVPIEEDVGQEKDGERWYESNRGVMRECVGLAAATGPHPMMQLKVTALMSARLCETVSRRLEEGEELTPERVEAVMGGGRRLPLPDAGREPALGGLLRRLDDVVGLAASRGVRVLVDAEQTWVNPRAAVGDGGADGAAQRGGAVGLGHAPGLPAGTRLEGAATARAAARGLFRGEAGARGLPGAGAAAREGAGGPDPLQPTLEGTHRSYGECLELALALAARDGRGVAVMVADAQRGVGAAGGREDGGAGHPRQGGGVCFGQLLGMCDHVSLALEPGRLHRLQVGALTGGGGDAAVPGAEGAREPGGAAGRPPRADASWPASCARRLLGRP
ncbi:unnamed protein product [Bubo scandiacus]